MRRLIKTCNTDNLARREEVNWCEYSEVLIMELGAGKEALVTTGLMRKNSTWVVR